MLPISTVFTQRGGGEWGIVEPEIRLEGQQFTKLGRKYQHPGIGVQAPPGPSSSLIINLIVLSGIREDCNIDSTPMKNSK